MSEKMADDFLMSPMVDYCFKELLAYPTVRKGFLAAILNRDPSEIGSTELLPTILEKETEEGKYGILDVRIRMKDGSQIDLEMQVVPFAFWERRILFYLSRMYTEQIKAGENYGEMKRCIHVSILNFIHFPEDQICFRDGWITVKTGIQKACKDTDIGGAYVGKDGYDFEKITPEDVDEKQIARNVKAVQDFFAKVSENVEKERLSFLLVPSSGLVMEDKLPAHARLFDQAKYIDQIEKQMTDCRVTDVRKDLLSHKDDYIYYKTDHHWTSEGAYLAYETWCDSTGMESTPLADLKKQVATQKFRGSLYSKILDADSAYDSIWTYGDTKQKTYGSDCSLTIDEKKQTDSCYDTAQLSQKDKYKYFFGDNYGTVQIVSDHARHQDRNLLVIKDSFANTFVPFATENYGQITMIDLRYYNGNVEEYMKEHQITDVLVLYNITNFISDRNLYKLVGRI